jgi:hypothetical protein
LLFLRLSKKMWLSTIFLLLIFTLSHANGQFTQQGPKLEGTAVGGKLGTSVAVSSNGSVMVAGAPFGASTGNVDVYLRSTTTWIFQTTLSCGTSHIGYSLAMTPDANTIVSGDPYYNSGVGGVCVFVKSGTTWVQQGSVLVGAGIVGPSIAQGNSVSISSDGKTIAVGGYGDNNYIGATWIFIHNTTGWFQQGGKLVGNNTIGSTVYQGFSVSLSGDGNTLAVGGYQDNSSVGAVWLFSRSGTIWIPQAKLYPSAQISFGYSVSLNNNGTVLGVGAIKYTVAGLQQGSLWMYGGATSAWNLQASYLVGSGSTPPSNIGNAVSVSSDGSTVAVGGYMDNNEDGATWVFTRSGLSWVQLGSILVGTDAGLFTAQGSSVALSSNGQILAVGGPFDDVNSIYGSVWMFVTPAAIYTTSPTSSPTVSPTLHPTSMAPTMSPTMQPNGLLANDTSASGLEDAYIPVTLVGSDSHGRNTSFYVVTFPTVGGLYTLDGTTYTQITSSSELFLTTTTPTFYYLGSLHYFTRAGTNTYVNGLGKGFNGCALTVAPGCPVTFTFGVAVTVDPTIVSAAATCSIQIQNVFTNLSTPYVIPSPQATQLNIMTDTGTWFTLVDYDQDLYMVLVSFTTNRGKIGYILTSDEQNQPGLTFQSCQSSLDLGCDTVTYYGYPSLVLFVIEQGFVEPTTANPNTGLIKYQAWKPAPDGITTANADDQYTSAVPAYREYVSINISTGTPAPTTNYDWLTTLNQDIWIIGYVFIILDVALAAWLLYLCYTTCTCCRRGGSCREGGSCRRCCTCQDTREKCGKRVDSWRNYLKRKNPEDVKQAEIDNLLGRNSTASSVTSEATRSTVSGVGRRNQRYSPKGRRRYIEEYL